MISDSANTQVAVVLSPACSTVFVAASRISIAPRFSTASGNSKFLATVKPSLDTLVGKWNNPS